MKQLIVLFVLLLSVYASAQTGGSVTIARATAPTSATLQSAATADGNGSTMNVAGFSAVTVRVTDAADWGSTTTVIFEKSLTGAAWVPARCAEETNGAAIVTSGTLIPGEFTCVVANYSLFRTRIQTYDAGTITAVGYAQAIPLAPLSDPQQLANLLADTSAIRSAVEDTDTRMADGSQQTQIVDGSGNVIGSTSNALDVNCASGCAGSGPTGDVSNAASIATVPDTAPVVRYNATQPTLTDGRFNLFQVDSRGSLFIAKGAGGFSIDNTGFNATQGGNWSVRAQDGSGNALTSNSTTYTAKFGLDVNVLGTLGTAFSTAGKVDVKGADGDMFVRQTTASNLNMTEVNSGAIKTSVELIDDVVATDDTTTHSTGTTKVLGIGAVATPTDAAVNANDIGMPAMSVNRELYAVVRDAAGNARGLNVDANGAIAVTATNATASNLKVAATLDAETTKVVGTVRVLGNGGATLDSTVGAGTAPTNQQVVGAIYNSTEISPTNGQAFALQADSKGRIRSVLMDAAGNTRGLNIDANGALAATVTNATATNLKAQAETYQGGTAVSSSAPLYTRSVDPCDAAKTHVAFSISTATTTQLIAASASNKAYICSINLVTAGANNIALVEDDTSACASPTAGMAGGTTSATGWNFAANGGMAFGNGMGTVFVTAATNRYVCFITSAAVQLSGSITYVLAP